MSLTTLYDLTNVVIINADPLIFNPRISYNREIWGLYLQANFSISYGGVSKQIHKELSYNPSIQYSRVSEGHLTNSFYLSLFLTESLDNQGDQINYYNNVLNKSEIHNQLTIKSAKYFKYPEIIKNKNDNYDPLSRYFNLQSYKYNDNKWLETWERIEIPFSDDDLYIKSNKRLDILSYEYYNTSKLWWVLAIVNNIYNPFMSTNTDNNYTINENENKLLINGLETNPNTMIISGFGDDDKNEDIENTPRDLIIKEYRKNSVLRIPPLSTIMSVIGIDNVSEL